MLAKAPASEDLRQELLKKLLDDANSLIPNVLRSGDRAAAERLLELGSESDRGIRNSAVYFFLEGRIDEKIARVERLPDEHFAGAAILPEKGRARFLVYLYWVKGDCKNALARAEKAGDDNLQMSILLGQADWKGAARVAARVSLADPFSGEDWTSGYLPALYRMAGNPAESEKAIAALLTEAKDFQQSEDPDNDARRVVAALLLNDRVAEGLALAGKANTTMAFELLAARCQYREALAIEGVADHRKPRAKWLGDDVKKLNAMKPDDANRRDAIKKLQERFNSGLRVAPLLCRLGEKQKAVDLFDQLAKAAGDCQYLNLNQVCRAEGEAGMKEQLLKHGLMLLSKQADRNAFRAIWPKQSTAAEHWWAFLRRKHPAEPPEMTLKRVRGLLEPEAAAGKPDDAWRAVVRAGADEAAKPDKARRMKWLSVLGDTCMAKGDRGLARDYYIQLIDLTSSHRSYYTVMQRVADSFFDEGRWPEAAEWYRRAIQRGCRRGHVLYLQGHATAKAGRQEEGKKLMQLALLLPLGEMRTRCAMAAGLEERGLRQEAARQWWFVLRFGSHTDGWATTLAASQLGEIVAESDPAAAVGCWQRQLLAWNTPDLGPSKTSEYLRLPFIIHESRAKLLLAEGKLDEAVAQARLAGAILPGAVTPVDVLVPELDNAGRRAEADEFFAAAYSTNERVCKDFPASATHHNNLAWLAALCDRHMEDALAHANRAVELVPDSPAYLDTLAEVHYRRGETQEALKHAKRCLELSPDDEHFKQQLERFTRGEQ